MKINIEVYEFEIMSFPVLFNKTTLNHNEVDVFDDYQIGYFSFRKYTSYNAKEIWLK
jgi:hypothetical protein